MNILMVTNTFTPHVGGVARSVQRFTDEYRKLGHDVVVVAPESAGDHRNGVIGIPSLQNVNGSSFALPLVFTDRVKRRLALHTAFNEPDVIHTHHPFLLGSIAKQLSVDFKVPLIFTHHTMYEQFAYVVGNMTLIPSVVSEMATDFANVCDHVIAPSRSTKKILRQRGVMAPITVIPTGVDVAAFSCGRADVFKAKHSIPASAAVFGHVGRLAKEKNLPFLVQSAMKALAREPRAYFVIVGDGPYAEHVRVAVRQHPRIVMTGSLGGQELADAYAAMDLFAFSSTAETQGMVLCEAMAAGVPVAALDAPGVRDVVVDGKNGFLCYQREPAALADCMVITLTMKDELVPGAKATAADLSQRRCAEHALSLYKAVPYGYKPLPIIDATISLLKRALR